MGGPAPFEQTLEAVENLTLDEQEALVDIVRRRLAEKRRQRIVQNVAEARLEFKEGKCRPATADEIMRELQA